MLSTFRNYRFGFLLFIFLIELCIFQLIRFLLTMYSLEYFEHTVSHFSSIFLVGLLYDITFLTYFNSALVLYFCFLPHKYFYKKWFKLFTMVLVFVSIGILLFSTVSEWIFWDEFSTRFNFISVDYLIYRREVSENVNQSYPVVLIFSFIFIVSISITYVIYKFIFKYLENSEPLKNRLMIFTAYCLSLILFVSLLDQSKRENIKNNYVKELSSNGPYQFFSAFRNNSLDYRQFYSLENDQKLSEKLLSLVGKTTKTDKLFDIQRDNSIVGEEREYNVVLISVESLSASFMSRYGNKENITPFLDELTQKSMNFSNFYATGTRTTRGLEAIALAVPPSPGRSIVKRPDNSGYPSMGAIFTEHGYDSAYIYGGRAYFDNMRAFFGGNGYRIIDQTDFKSDEITFSNAWGVSDENLFDKAIKEADMDFSRQKKFFFHVMTVSNHRPYTYNENRIDIPSGTGREGAVKYTDYAIGSFLKNAEKKPWFKNTIFLIVADHCASCAGRIGLPIEKYHIPLIIYAPAIIKPIDITKLSSQIDIAPTLFSLLNFKYNNRFFGADILDPNYTERAFIGNYQKLGYLKNKKLVVLSPQQKVDVFDYVDEKMTYAKKDSAMEYIFEAKAFYQGADFLIKNDVYRNIH